MKIKGGQVSISSKNKHALPQSKVLKPKKLKQKNVSNRKGNKYTKQKILSAIKEAMPVTNETIPKRNSSKIEKTQICDNIGKVNPPRAKVYKPITTDSRKPSPGKKLSISANNVMDEKETTSEVINNKTIGVTANENGDMFSKTQLSLDKVTSAVAALSKIMKKDKNELLDLPEPIFMEVECIKIPICSTKQLRFKLPHPLAGELSDVLLITADKKGAKIYPEKAVEYYNELLAKNDVNFIQKVMPMRTIIKECSQYEQRRKLVAQYDVILADAKIIRSLPSRLGKFIMYKSKMPIPVQLDRKNLKQHLLNAISKTQMTVRGTGHKTIVQVGHMKMAERDVAENILAVTQGLKTTFPGGWKNIRSLDIKTSKSIALPVYFSLASPNTVETPVEQPQVPEPVEGELSTMLGAKVVVRADGAVRVKRIPEEPTELDDSKDDEILEETKKYVQSRKTVRNDEHNDSDDGDAVTDAMEKKIIENYNLSKKAKDENSDEDNEEEENDEEGEESSEEDEPIPPIVGQKRKKEQRNKQESGKSPNKKQKPTQQQGKPKGNKKIAEKSVQNKKDQRRGSRGGKKNKLNKHQRKGMLKKNKAGNK